MNAAAALDSAERVERRWPARAASVAIRSARAGDADAIYALLAATLAP